MGHHTVRLTIAVFACVLACHLLVHANGKTAGEESLPDNVASELIGRFLSNTDTPLTSYEAFRTLEAETRGGHMRARLTARTSLDPVTGFQYSIIDETGSGIIRQKVLRAALEAERSLRANGDVGRGGLTASNYDFTDDRGSEDGFRRIRIRPKRHDTMLLDGSILLTDPEGDLISVEGFLIKRPSIWTREVAVVRRYERIGGVRVPVAMESTARVLIAGRSTFSMLYEYVSINGLALLNSNPS
jgi:hypothetical protein